MSLNKPNNKKIANLLEQIAGLLETQEANRFRIRAYRKAAAHIRKTKKPVAKMLQEGEKKLQDELKGVGESLARVISDYVHTGRSNQLERLKGKVSPEDVLRRVPGIGEKTAHRLHSELDIETLEGLELAAHDGRLENLKGFGQRRVSGIRKTLAGMLNRSARRNAPSRLPKDDKEDLHQPPVGDILDVDEEYRNRAQAGKLKKIAPRRFNPEGKAWLPILHMERGDWNFTALFSNTARAHDLGKTHDWVVVYYEKSGTENQCTVVTQKSGDLEGKRVVRGREQECKKFYKA